MKRYMRDIAQRANKEIGPQHEHRQRMVANAAAESLCDKKQSGRNGQGAMRVRLDLWFVQKVDQSQGRSVARNQRAVPLLGNCAALPSTSRVRWLERSGQFPPPSARLVRLRPSA